MVTSTDITNRALQLVGTRTNVASLVETSNEAIQASLAYNAIQSWCFGLVNWNFARSTAALTQAKSVASGAPSPWSSASPAPPWLYEYTLPGDFVKALYLTNSDPNGTTNYLGELKRFALAVDTISTVQQEVLLTNESSAILVYTALVSNVTIWPWYFERLMVTALAATLAYVLTGDKELLKYLDDLLTRQIAISEEANRKEGLEFDDTTPEWIQAIGINYPFRRNDGKPKPQGPSR